MATIDQVEDQATREILIQVLEKLNQIQNLPPCTNDPQQISMIVNKITGNT